MASLKHIEKVRAAQLDRIERKLDALLKAQGIKLEEPAPAPAAEPEPETSEGEQPEEGKPETPEGEQPEKPRTKKK